MTDLISLYLDPCTIKANALESLQEKITGGDAIVEANNVPMWFLEHQSTLIGNSMLAMKQYIDVSSYKLRASSTEDLYRHMSNYDFIGVYATPTLTEIIIELDKSYLVYEAKSYSDIYRKIVIPVNTEFSFGDYTFGIYYPIDILINKKTEVVTVNWDLSEVNPLHTLEESALDVLEVTEDSIDLIQIRIPIYQFKRVVSEISVTADTGLITSVTYSDNFYALRVFHYKNETWVPLTVTMSETVYDVDDPTVRFIVESENQFVKLTIPPIYFTTNQISNKIKVEIYTTKGELEVDVSSIDADTVVKNFKVTATDTYSSLLNKISAIPIYFTKSKIIGGSNGISFTELKNRVINNSFHGNVITTPSDIESYFSNLGFSATRYACNVTNMIYLCHKQMFNSKGGVIAAGNIKTIITNEIVSLCDTIIENTDGSLTILPSTIYKYDNINDICIPLTTEEAEILTTSNKESKVQKYNSNIYTKSPFHIRLDRNNRYPMAYTYDLNQPTADYLHSTGENTEVDVILKIYDIAIVHDGVSGYDIKLLVAHTGSFTTDDVAIFFYTKNVGLAKVWAEATFVSEYEDKWVFNIHIDTNYTLFKDGTIFLNSLRTDAGQYGHEVNLDFKGNFTLLLKSDLLSGESLNPSIGYDVPDEFSSYTALLEQQANISLGSYLSGIYNNVDVIYKEAIYATYETDVYVTAETDIYERDNNGYLVYTVVNDLPVYNKIYSVGDQVLDQEGLPIVKHAAGDIIIVDNAPIVLNERDLDYYIDMIHIDGKLDIVTDASYINIMNYSREVLLSYMTTISEASDQLLEGTKLYFSPIRTIGSTNSSIGNSVSIKHSLELTLRLKLYVYDYVNKSEEIKSNIYSNIVNLIDEYTANSDDPIIAMDVIVSLIKTHLSEYIINVDVYGFFDDQTIQTLISTSTDVKPHLKQYLVIADDGTITVARGLTLDYVTI